MTPKTQTSNSNHSQQNKPLKKLQGEVATSGLRSLDDKSADTPIQTQQTAEDFLKYKEYYVEEASGNPINRYVHFKEDVLTALKLKEQEVKGYVLSNLDRYIETNEILSNPEIMSSINKSLRQFEEGKGIPLKDLCSGGSNSNQGMEGEKSPSFNSIKQQAQQELWDAIKNDVFSYEEAEVSSDLAYTRKEEIKKRFSLK